MDRCSFFNRVRHFPITRLAAVMLVALALGTRALCSEIHDAAKNGDLEKVKALLKDNPDLAFNKDIDGATPLQLCGV
jgi:ankyrin repeat protein